MLCAIKEGKRVACRAYETGDGEIMFVCAEDESAFKPATCYICGKEATSACDYSEHGVLSLCEHTMCEEHSHRIDLDTHVCGKHFNEVNIKKAKKIRNTLVQFGWQYPRENCDGAGI